MNVSAYVSIKKKKKEKIKAKNEKDMQKAQKILEERKSFISNVSSSCKNLF